jgi:stage II sporulation protein M
MKTTKMKKRKRGFSLKEQYNLSWNYINESRNFIYIIVGVFFVFSLIGFLIPAPDIVSEQIMKFVEELIKKTQGMSMLELIGFIFSNNLQSSFFGMVFGVLFGIFPIVAAIANGYLVGFVGLIAVESEGFSTLFRLFPHGIFELPAVFISLGLGLRFGMFIFQKEKTESLAKYFWNSLRVFLFVVIPLLIIAAIIEGTFIFVFS